MADDGARAGSEVGANDFIELFVSVLRGLKFIHSRGLVHLDLKPDNVLIKAPVVPKGSDEVRGAALRPCPKLIDFGLAKKEKDFGGKSIMGTTYYIAPETILGARVDRRTDLYSLGVVMYQLTTGQLPFRGRSNLEVFKGHLERSPEPPDQHADFIPPPLSAIILRMMEKKPDDRFQSAIDVIDAINGTLVTPLSWRRKKASWGIWTPLGRWPGSESQ